MERMNLVKEVKRFLVPANYRAGLLSGKTKPFGTWLHQQTASSQLSVGLRTYVVFRQASRFCVTIRSFVLIELSRDTPGKTKPDRSYGSDTLPIFLKPPETGLSLNLRRLDHFSRGGPTNLARVPGRPWPAVLKLI